MSVLAFNDPFHDASYCWLDGAGPQHIELERFTRRKLDRLSPLLGALLLEPDWAARLDEVQALAVVEGEFLAPLFRRIVAAKARGVTDASPLTHALLQALGADQARVLPMEVSAQTQLGDLRPYRAGLEQFVRHALRPTVRVAVLGHHHCHAAHAFFDSPFDEALSVSLDGGGYDFVAGPGGPRTEVYGSVFDGQGASVTAREWVTDLSFASAWARMTRHVFGLNFGEEGTVMAMAALGRPARFGAAVSAPWIWQPAEALATPDNARSYVAQIGELRRAIRGEQDRFDMAAALQQQTEYGVEAFLREVVGEDVRNLCLSGGLFLNCQVMGQVQAALPWVERVFVPPAPYDGGLSVGAAEIMWHGDLGMPRTIQALAPFATGPAYSEADIRGAARERQVGLQHAAAAHVAALLASGRIGALFAGPAESGRRALGHRSILADPQNPMSRGRINGYIKRRAEFRPLAPSVLAEHVHDWFEASPDFASPYMSFALKVRRDRAARIPAVLHADGTARVQTVHRELTPHFHALLTAWNELTGVPVLLNTSFNENEPIVQTPDEALDCYGRTPLDFLYFADAGLLACKG